MTEEDPYRALYDYDRPKWGLNVWRREVRGEERAFSIKKHREIFEPAITCFKSNLRRTKISDRPLRISENEIFLGGYLSRHLSRIYHERLLVLALEYKKIFMDEWTGELYPDILDKLASDFNSSVDRAVETCLTTI